jgi:hypothetical protein
MGSLYGANLYNPGVYSHGNLWSLTGNIPVTVSFGGTMSNPVALAGNLVVPVSLGSSIAALWALAGDLTVHVSLAAQLTADFGLTGNLAPAVSLGANLGVSYQMRAGDIPIAVPMAADGTRMTSGPLWEPDDAQCPAVPWGPSAACNG